MTRNTSLSPPLGAVTVTKGMAMMNDKDNDTNEETTRTYVHVYVYDDNMYTVM